MRAGARGNLRGFAPFDPVFSWRTLATGTHPDDQLLDPPPFWIRCADADRAGVVGWPGFADLCPAQLAAPVAQLEVHPKELDPRLLGLLLPRHTPGVEADDRQAAWLLERLAQVYTVHNRSIVLARQGELDVLAVCHGFLREVGDRYFPPKPIRATPRWLLEPTD